MTTHDSDNSTTSWSARARHRRRNTVLGVVTALVLVVSACSTGTGRHDRSSMSTTDNGAPTPMGLHFTDVAKEAGLTESHSDLALFGNRGMTSGAAVADVDGDGYPDIFLPRVGKPDALYMNDGSGHFTDVARKSGLSGPTDRAGSTAAAFLDADGDGHLDLFVTGITPGDNHLYMNDGTGYFVDEARSRGLVWDIAPDEDRDDNMHGISVADVNGDGYLDLLVLQWHTDIYTQDELATVERARTRPPFSERGLSSCDVADILAETDTTTAGRDEMEPSLSRLFLNDGTGNFRDVTVEYGLDLDEVVAFTGVFRDLDGDGWPDLLLTGDFCTSRIYRNVEGTHFVDVTDLAGVGTDENGMGSVVRDFNGDGLPDWFITAIAYGDPGGRCPADSLAGGCSGNRLFINNGDMTFTDATDDFGIRDGGWGWGAAVEDFANTGDIQVVMTNGFDWGREDPDPDDPATEYYESFKTDRTRFWFRDGLTRYRDMASEIGITDTTIGHALVAFDMDNDGDLDILIIPTNESPILYRNDTPQDRSWLTIRLDDQTSPGNRWGDGARLEIYFTDRDDPLVDWISTSGSYESQKPPLVHVGAGQATDPVESIRVFWPSEQEPQVVENVDMNQQLTIQRTK